MYIGYIEKYIVFIFRRLAWNFSLFWLTEQKNFTIYFQEQDAKILKFADFLSKIKENDVKIYLKHCDDSYETYKNMFVFVNIFNIILNVTSACQAGI